MTASAEAEIISELLKKHFSVWQSGEQKYNCKATANAEFTSNYWTWKLSGELII